MRTIALVALAGLAGVGCKGKAKDGGGPGSGSGSGTAGTTAAATCAGPDAKGPLRWFEDDYPAALACARASHRPLVIDMWAPWCHTCLSMSATVLIDPSLAPLADRFVWLALDTDREANAAAVGTFALQNWPTYFVLDAADESIAARWLGAAAAPQFRQFLTDGERAVLASRGGAALDPLLAQVRAGDVAASAKDWAAAEAAYAGALAAAPADWPRRPDVLVAQIAARQKAGDVAGCLALGTSAAGQTGASANATDFLVWALACADAEGADPAAAKALRERAVSVLGALDAQADAPLSLDDRSDLMLNLREALGALGRTDDARAVATRQAALLDDAAAKAGSPAVAMTYNWHRAEVYVFLGKGAEIVPALEQSTKDLPTEYDPPYRLAWVYLRMGQAAEAKRWAEDALGKAYGPRKVRVANLVVEACKALGDGAAERAAREGLVATLAALPPEMAQPENLAKARADLAAMTGTGPPDRTGPEPEPEPEPERADP
ncbi:MAG: thioredoxin family protein [Myxococcales bacterium]|nr:thioredoxin family protein [Myxococcales bacterium]